MATCNTDRGNLAGLATEQSKALGDLTLTANERKAKAEEAVDEAKIGAKTEYTSTNRLHQDRPGGDQWAAAASIIDQELGL